MNELGKHKVIGLDSLMTVGSGAIARLTVRPQIPFKVERILVSARVAPYFLIHNISVGKNSETVAAGGIHTGVFAVREDFAQNPFKHGEITEGMIRGERFDMDVCMPGYDLVMEVVNIDMTARRFLCGLAGREVSNG